MCLLEREEGGGNRSIQKEKKILTHRKTHRDTLQIDRDCVNLCEMDDQV